MKTVLIVAILSTGLIRAQSLLPPVPSTPVNVIIDTDIGTDPDDVHAVAIALRLRQLGYFNIKALTSSTWIDKAAALLNLMLAHGGLTASDIPLGAYRGPRPVGTGGAGCFDGDSADNYAGATLSALPIVPIVGRASFPDAVAVMRAALASSADHSVVIITLGGLTNIAGLLQSQENANNDGFASGQALWDTKVTRMVSQFSGFPPSYPYTASPYTQATGYNASCDAPAAAYVLSHNGTVPIIGAPMQVTMYIGGCFDGTGAGCTSALPVSSPVRVASAKYKAIGGLYTVGAGNFGRSAWDPGAVFYALVGNSDPGGGAYYAISPNGTMSFVATYPATSTWTTALSANHFFVINTGRWVAQQTAMNTLLQDGYLPVATTTEPPPPPSPFIIKCDLNTDGRVDISDVAIAVSQAMGPTCSMADINGDGKCDLLDVQRVLTAAMTGTCQVGI